MDNYEYTSCCPRQERLQLVIIISIHNKFHDIFMLVIVINPSIIVSVEAVQVFTLLVRKPSCMQTSSKNYRPIFHKLAHYELIRFFRIMNVVDEVRHAVN